MDPDQIAQLFPIPPPSLVVPLAGGANNRVYKLEFPDHPPLVLKQYFQDVRDPRPRLRSEFSFLQYAWEVGLRNIPKPCFASQDVNAALYSYVPAFPIQPGHFISDNLIQQKIEFFLRLNERKKEGLHLFQASEACLSPQQYLEITEKRIVKLSQAPEDLLLAKELKNFVIHHVLPKWSRLKTKCKTALHSCNSEALSIENQCISPSDFGFHNALIHDCQLTFIDFEYAGWDDPCKTICDLFCQPKIPIPPGYFSKVLNAFSQSIPDPESLFKRVDLFLPVIQMKWCCIILNAFTKVGESRRKFSQSDEVEHLERQFLLARERFEQINI